MRKRFAEASEAEHGERDQGLRGVEAEGDAGDEADLGVVILRLVTETHFDRLGNWRLQ